MRIISLLFITFIMSCGTSDRKEQEEVPLFENILQEAPSIDGKVAYLNSPYTTAGDRLYMVGHQDGSFPELGWHIKGEMGGIWNHPIKLMDGFTIEVLSGEDTIALDKAVQFTNYPMANKHTFSLSKHQLSIDRWQFVPDHKEGMLIQLAVENEANEPQEVKIRFTGYSDLRPTWLGERTKMIDDSDKGTYDEAHGGWIFNDSQNPWLVLFGADRQPIQQQEGTTPYAGKGAAGALTYEIPVASGQVKTINFIIAGSYQGKEQLQDTYSDIKSDWPNYLKEKRDRYTALAQQSKLTIPDKDIETTFEWLKYNSDWLIRTVPEIGTGIMAGIPDYPWWFGVDSEYALKGYMAIGQEEAVLQTIELIDSISNAVNGNGRIVHEVSTNGAVFNEGNINETPQYASLIWEIFRWNGDRAFLEKYFPTVQKGLEWLIREKDTNDNGFPEGFGMMEIHGLDSEMIDVAAYTQRAFADAAKMAMVLEKEALAAAYHQKAKVLKEEINARFWSQEFKSYADFIGTDEQALHLIEDAIVRADTLDKPWAVKELERTRQQIRANPSSEPRPFVMHHNWVVNTPMEMGIAEPEQALVALETARQFVNPFGVFVTGIDRDESAGKEGGSFKGSQVFSYTGAVMTLPTGVQAVAENNYGRPDVALDYLKRMSRSFSYALPGSMYEVSPDYGMMTQAWNIYAYAVPIVQQFFGVQPNAMEKQIVIKPGMPSIWESASLENVAIKDNKLDIYYTASADRINLKLEQTAEDWQLKVVLPIDTEQGIEVKGGETKVEEGQLVVYTTGGKLEIDYNK